MIAPPSIVLLVHVRVFLPLLVRLHACTIQLLRLHRVPQSRKKTFVGKNTLAGVPDDRCNSSARIRRKCVIVPRWPMPGTGFQVNITTLTVILSYHRVVIVANRRRVQQCHAAAVALLRMMERHEARLLVITHACIYVTL